MAFCSVLFFAQNTFPAGHCTTVHLTVNIPAQWLWPIIQLGSVSRRRECFSLLSAPLFCSWLEQAAVPGVILGPLPITVSDVNTFLNVWLLALFPNTSFKKNSSHCNLFGRHSLSLASLAIGQTDWIFLSFKQINYVNCCLLTLIKAHSCLEDQTVHSILLSQQRQVDENLNESLIFHFK